MVYSNRFNLTEAWNLRIWHSTTETWGDIEVAQKTHYLLFEFMNYFNFFNTMHERVSMYLTRE